MNVRVESVLFCNVCYKQQGDFKVMSEEYMEVQLCLQSNFSVWGGNWGRGKDAK